MSGIIGLWNFDGAPVERALVERLAAALHHRGPDATGIWTEGGAGMAACLRNARAKGKTLGRPRVAVDAARIGRLRSQGRTVREIAEELGYSRSLVHKTLANGGSLRVANATD
jgi:glutamine phosphoribosylpyrophosphate amidotransferase